MDKASIIKVKDAWKANKISRPAKSDLAINTLDQVAALFSAGNFYYYIINFNTHKMEYVDSRVKDILGISPEEFTLNQAFELMHPEDLQEMHKKEAKIVDFLINKIPVEDILRYKVVYLMRVRHADGSYKTILHQSKTLTISEDGKAQHVIGIHTDVTYQNIPVDHKISFIGDNRPSYYGVSTDEEFTLEQHDYNLLFTPREKEILSNISKGKSFAEIAKLFNVSPHTINTHKKNILKKTDCKNTTELIARCVRLGII